MSTKTIFLVNAKIAYTIEGNDESEGTNLWHEIKAHSEKARGICEAPQVSFNL